LLRQKKSAIFGPMLIPRFLEIWFLGFLCGLIPGPVVTAIFTETIRKGWKSARRIVLLAAVGEALMSVICVAALSLIPAESIVFSVLSMFGALILVNLAWDLWRVEEINENEPLFSNQRVLMLALFNGMAWIFWITVCTPQAVALGQMIPGGQWLFIVLFETGWLCSTFTLCYLFGFFRPYFQNNKKLHLLYRTVALLFLGFALKLAIGSARSLLS
jgi:threonine/homoserine/homoserine lactone efflux protein